MKAAEVKKHNPEVFAEEVNDRTSEVVCESDVGRFEETPFKYQNAEYVDINHNQKQKTEGGNKTNQNMKQQREDNEKGTDWEQVPTFDW